MSGRARTTKKREAKEPPKNVKPAKKAIDMTHIPESLKMEGYSAEKIFTKIPDYLSCPVCKELFINPEMLFCGHTICKVCLENLFLSARPYTCPVCKTSAYGNPIPNFALKQLIEEQFREELKIRTGELEEMQGLKKKVEQYGFSERYSKLAQAFDEYLSTQRYALYNDVLQHLKSVDIKPAISEEEGQYFLSIKLLGSYSAGWVGDCLYWKMDVETFLNWIESSSNEVKGNKDHKKWCAFLIPVLMSGRTLQPATLEKIGKYYGVELGVSLPVLEWKNKPARWIKDIELGTINLDAHLPCGHPPGFHDVHVFTDSEDEFDSDEDSDY